MTAVTNMATKRERERERERESRWKEIIDKLEVCRNEYMEMVRKKIIIINTAMYKIVFCVGRAHCV